MIGLVLAAGTGRRLAPLTNELPKALLPVVGERTILDITLQNLRGVGIVEVVVVVGFAAPRIEERVPDLERDHGLRLHLLPNDHGEMWNNAYSLWLARDAFRDAVLLVNGDTVHPPSVERTVLAARGPRLLLAVDDAKTLGEEEMKVAIDDSGALRSINKSLDPATADGEYIGVTLIEPAAGPGLAAALEATWRADPGRYYEDGYQHYAERCGRVDVVPIGGVDWVEVDDARDLARAREIACRY